MGSSVKKKLKRILRSGNYPALKRVFKDERPLDLSRRLDSRGRTALHLACKTQHAKVIAYLLKKGADGMVRDYQGNVALLLAMKMAHKIQQVQSDASSSPCSKIHLVYKKMVLPLIRAFPHASPVPNEKMEDGWIYLRKMQKYVTDCPCNTRKHLDLLTILELIEDCMSESHNSNGHSASKGKNLYDVDDSADEKSDHDNWNEKLADEMNFEYATHEGHFANDYDCDERDRHESYDTWASRMYKEHQRKKNDNPWNAPRGKAKTEETSSSWTPLDQERFEEQQRVLEKERRQQHRTHKLLKRKKNYQKQCSVLFGEGDRLISSADLPDEENLVEILLCDIDGKSEQKAFIREQQYLWHPDKFSQKCVHRIPEDSREQILNKVNQISQCINAHLKDL